MISEVFAFQKKKNRQDKMAAKLNKRSIHYREEVGLRAISPLKITKPSPGKPKAVIRQSHYWLPLNAECVSVTERGHESVRAHK